MICMAVRLTATELKALRIKLRLKQPEIAKLLEVDRGIYKNWEIESRGGPPEKYVDQILQLEFDMVGETLDRLRGVRKIPMKKIPIAGKAAAGSGVYNVDNDDEWLSVPADMVIDGSLGFTIQGDSMMPILRENDIAVFFPSSSPSNNPGKIFLVKMPDSELRCKVIDYRADGWTLVSTNPAYEAESLGGAQVLGFLIGLYRSNEGHFRMESKFAGFRPVDLL